MFLREWIPAVLAAALLAGCSSGTTSQNTSLPQQYEMTARMNFQGMETQILLRRDGRDTLEFQSPAGLRGLCLSMDQNTLTMNYSGLERQFTRGSLPETSAAGVLLTTLDTAAQTGIPANGECIGPWGKYSLLLEEGSGNILKLSIPGQSLDLQVQDFKILAENA